MRIFAVIISIAMILVEKIICFLDLSHSLNSDTLNWTPEEKFSLTDQVIVDNPPSFYATNAFVGPEHCGTHLDAPYHFNKNGWKVDEIPLSHLICPGILIDVSEKIGNNSNFELMPEHLKEWERIHGCIPRGVIILLNFGWSRRYSDRISYYGNISAPYSFPGISLAAAKWIVRHGGIHGIALDTPSIDPGYSETYPAHDTLLKANIFGIENIFLDGIQLPPKGFRVIALPMKITGGTGAPCRVVIDEILEQIA